MSNIVLASCALAVVVAIRGGSAALGLAVGAFIMAAVADAARWWK